MSPIFFLSPNLTKLESNTKKSALMSLFINFIFIIEFSHPVCSKFGWVSFFSYQTLSSYLFLAFGTKSCMKVCLFLYILCNYIIHSVCTVSENSFIRHFLILEMKKRWSIIIFYLSYIIMIQYLFDCSALLQVQGPSCPLVQSRKEIV